MHNRVACLVLQSHSTYKGRPTPETPETTLVLLQSSALIYDLPNPLYTPYLSNNYVLHVAHCRTRRYYSSPVRCRPPPSAPPFPRQQGSYAAMGFPQR
jgi:hypothetical protein